MPRIRLVEQENAPQASQLLVEQARANIAGGQMIDSSGEFCRLPHSQGLPGSRREPAGGGIRSLDAGDHRRSGPGL